jgi:predicted TPR repeat methyltransferase
MVKQLVKAEPDSAELQYFLGEAYRRRNAKGDLESAAAAYQAAIAAMGAPNVAYRGLGLTALKSGQKDVARNAFQKYLSLEPDAKDRAIVEYYLTTVGGTP